MKIYRECCKTLCIEKRKHYFYHGEQSDKLLKRNPIVYDSILPTPSFHLSHTFLTLMNTQKILKKTDTTSRPISSQRMTFEIIVTEKKQKQAYPGKPARRSFWRHFLLVSHFLATSLMLSTPHIALNDDSPSSPDAGNRFTPARMTLTFATENIVRDH